MSSINIMNEWLNLIFVFIAGLGLGAIFFGGLYVTVQRGLLSRHLVFWFLSSLLLRMGLVLTGFYFIADDQWQRLLACMLGFIAMRTVIQLLTKVSKINKTISDVSHHAT